MVIIVVSEGSADLVTQPGLGIKRDQDGAKDQPEILLNGPISRKKRRKLRGRHPDKDPKR